MNAVATTSLVSGQTLYVTVCGPYAVPLRDPYTNKSRAALRSEDGARAATLVIVEGVSWLVVTPPDRYVEGGLAGLPIDGPVSWRTRWDNLDVEIVRVIGTMTETIETEAQWKQLLL